MRHQSKQEGMWRALFQQQHSLLTEIAEILLYRSVSPEVVIQAALAELEGHLFDKSFGNVSATRAVVKAAIAYNYTAIDSWIAAASSGPVSGDYSGPLPLESLPWAERAVYFLREVLRYSRRDTALLLGISDTNVDELNKFARRRMGIQVDTVHDSPAPRRSPVRAMGSLHARAFTTYE